jgi:hypothetical protein
LQSPLQPPQTLPLQSPLQTPNQPQQSKQAKQPKSPPPLKQKTSVPRELPSSYDSSIPIPKTTAPRTEPKNRKYGKGFIKKTDKFGRINPMYIDVLSEDKPISGQNFVCLSFLTPEKILKQKNHYFFEEFMKYWEYTKYIEFMRLFIHYTSFKYNLDPQLMMQDLEEFVIEQKKALLETTITEDYKTFIEQREDELQSKFDKENGFQTSISGIKIGGVFDTHEEAELRCKMLHEVDNTYDISIGEVGKWLPYDPDAYKTGNVIYMEEELNQLMHEKMKNEKNAKQHFDQRLKESKRKAIEENIEKARQTGNVLTQTIDPESGNLIGIQNMITQETTLLSGGGPVSQEQIHDVLFDDSNINLERLS